jgi:hypothetical protein
MEVSDVYEVYGVASETQQSGKEETRKGKRKSNPQKQPEVTGQDGQPSQLLCTFLCV